MARPRPAGPSRRVYAAFGIASALGAAVFLIWWLTAGGGRRPQPADATPPPAAQLPSPEARIEVSLPRGGSLAGSTDDRDGAAARLTGATLVRLNRATDTLEPGLAESWTASPDNLLYTVKLRAGLAWPDGRPYTAADVVAAIGPVEVLGKPLVLNARDAQTIDVRFAQPFAPALRVFATRPVAGTGPFVEAEDGVFARNPHYWRKAGDNSPLPYLDSIELVEGRPGEHDFADMAARPEDVEKLRQLEAAGKIRLFDLGPALDADAMWFAPAAPAGGEAGARNVPRSDRPWLADEKFRLAISTAVDRREYCKQVFYGACDPIAGPVTPANISWFNPDLPIGRPDPGLARAMLGEMGLRDRTGDGILDDAAVRPVRFALLVSGDATHAARAARFLASTLRAIGVDMTVTPLSASALASRRQKGSYDAIYDRIEMADTDPAMNLDFWLSSGARHPWNPARTSPPADWERQIDQLMLKTAASFDRIERLQAFVDAQKLYAQHMPAIFFGAPYIRIVTSMRTLNATPSILRPHLLWNAGALAVLK